MDSPGLTTHGRVGAHQIAQALGWLCPVERFAHSAGVALCDECKVHCEYMRAD